MNGPAQDAYHAYHVHLGTVPAAAPFELLSPREQEAWANVAHVTAAQLYRLEGAMQNAAQAERDAEAAEEKLHDANLRIEELEGQLKAATTAKEPPK